MKRLNLLVLFAFLIFSFASVNAFERDSCSDGILAYWQFEGNYNDSIKGLVGIPEGNVEIEQDKGKISKGIQFGQSGPTSSFGTVNISSSSSLDPLDDFTVMFWFKFQGVTQKGNLINNGKYKIYLDNSIRVTVGDTSLEKESFNANNFYFVTVVGDESDLTLTLYINGDYEDSVSLGTDFFSQTSTSPLVFGEGFLGIMDEIAFFNVALNSSEVEAYYDVSNGGSDYCDESLSGHGSQTDIEFSIPGCNIPGYGLLSIGGCSGRYYCSNDEGEVKYYDTLDVANASLQGKTSLGEGERGCCPVGYYAKNGVNEDNPEDYYCVQLTRNCDAITEKDNCEQEFCFWIEDGEASYCIGSLDGLGCSSYKSEVACEKDVNLLSIFGYGTENCERFDFGIQCSERFTVQGCSCAWEDGKCVLSYNLTSTQASGEEDPSQYTCEKFFEMGECIKGQQEVNWTAKLKSSSGLVVTNPSVDESCVIDGIECKDGRSSRFCGDETVKLFGFSIFSFILSVLSIAVFYFFSRRFGKIYKE